MTQLIILDRDGVINNDSLHYIKNPAEFVLIEHAARAIACLYQAGYTIAVATNQSGVSRGLYSEATLQRINQKMCAAVHQAGGVIHAIKYCIHLPEEQCLCRKPQPGMLLALAQQFNCHLASVYFIGDRISDIQAACAAGAKPIVILSNMTDKVALLDYPWVPQYRSLMDFVARLLSHEPRL